MPNEICGGPGCPSCGNCCADILHTYPKGVLKVRCTECQSVYLQDL